jgi:hypothetical protein
VGSVEPCSQAPGAAGEAACRGVPGSECAVARSVCAGAGTHTDSQMASGGSSLRRFSDESMLSFRL